MNCGFATMFVPPSPSPNIHPTCIARNRTEDWHMRERTSYQPNPQSPISWSQSPFPNSLQTVKSDLTNSAVRLLVGTLISTIISLRWITTSMLLSMGRRDLHRRMLMWVTVWDLVVDARMGICEFPGEILGCGNDVVGRLLEGWWMARRGFLFEGCLILPRSSLASVDRTGYITSVDSRGQRRWHSKGCRRLGAVFPYSFLLLLVFASDLRGEYFSGKQRGTHESPTGTPTTSKPRVSHESSNDKLIVISIHW